MTEPKFKEGDKVIWSSKPTKVINIVRVDLNGCNQWEYWNDCFGKTERQLSYFSHDYAVTAVRKLTKLDKALK